MADAAEFMEATWPLIHVRYGREFSAAAVQGTIDGYERLLRRKERFVSLVDGSQIVKFPGSAERSMLNAWLKEPGRTEKEKLYAIGYVVVLPSGPLRAMMSAIQWVNPPNSPQAWKATVPEAFEWCIERLVEAKLPLTPAIEGWRAELLKTSLQRAR
jgi:hypothetical protein